MALPKFRIPQQASVVLNDQRHLALSLDPLGRGDSLTLLRRQEPGRIRLMRYALECLWPAISSCPQGDTLHIVCGSGRHNWILEGDRVLRAIDKDLDVARDIVLHRLKLDPNEFFWAIDNMAEPGRKRSVKIRKD